MLSFNLKYFSALLLPGFTIYNLRYFMLKNNKNLMFIRVNRGFEFKTGTEK
jgi:hypothetical protein